MAPPPAPRWLTSGQVSAQYLRAVYSTLMEREAARRQLQRASRDVVIPSRLQPPERKRDSLKKFFKHGISGSGSGSSDELSEAEAFYSVRAASTPVNQNRNRYADIEPYDRNRVQVGSNGANEVEGRYLNASWVREVEGRAWWIAAQAPLFETTHAFLSLFTSLQPESLRPTTIVQLTPIVENNIRKADQYIPTQTSSAPLHFYPENDRSDLPAIEVSLKSSDFISEADCVVRTVQLKLLTKPQPEVVEIKHIDYEGWPDHGIPTNSDELIHLVRVAQEINAAAVSGSAPPRPIVCHCSAGVGRTGTFIALSSLLRAYGFLTAVPEAGPEGFPLDHLFPLAGGSPLGVLPNSISDDPVAREVDGLREQRTTMVQRSEQLGVVYQVLLNIVTSSQS
ncbi:hypothetical protein FRB90_000683 [Tulasnella sp. 427]|nr:hypothetical protein FRB90_000683 [Tulasnella sp. 427]